MRTVAQGTDKAGTIGASPAVLGATHLYLPGGRAAVLPEVESLEAATVAERACRAGARAVMVHASAPELRGLPAGGTPFRTVAAGAGTVELILLAEDDKRKMCGPWVTVADAEILARSLEVWRAWVGVPWLGSPGRTGEALMYSTHPKELGGVQLGRAPTLPELAGVVGARMGALEPAYGWRRKLTAVERRATTIHAFDLNAQYLAAWQVVGLGLGDPEHYAGHVDLEAFYSPTPDGTARRLKAPPGMYRLRLPARPLQPALPNAWGDGGSAVTWVTAPTLERAAELFGEALPPVTEAWTWPRASKYLRPAAERLRDARAALRADPSPEAAAALAAVKEVYARGTGRLAWGQARNGWPRPDWRLAVIAQARVNLHRRLAKLGAAPFAILVDGVYFAAAETDPVAFAEAIGLPVGDRLGQFSHEASLPAAPLLEALTKAATASAVAKVIREAPRGSR